MRTFVLAIAALSFFISTSSCTSAKKLTKAMEKKDSIPIAKSTREYSLKYAAGILDTLENGRIDYTTFSAKIDVDYVGGDGKKESVNANLRMYKDSLIWVSITGLFGIEGMRAHITTDSIKMLNKLDKVYTARSVAYLQKVTGLPLTLQSVQDLIIGNPIFLDSNIVSYESNGSSVSLLTIGELFKNLLTVTGGRLSHCKLDDVDMNRNRTCDLSYDDYELKKDIPFSAKRRITVSEKSKLDIKLDFRSYTFNETLSFPFSVPKNYKIE